MRDSIVFISLPYNLIEATIYRNLICLHENTVITLECKCEKALMTVHKKLTKFLLFKLFSINWNPFKDCHVDLRGEIITKIN